MQLLAFGFTPAAIRHRIATGRLHPVYPGVYAVGRPQLTEHGSFIAAVLACGDRAALSHDSAAALWRIRPWRGRIHVSIPGSRRGHEGIAIHRGRNVKTTVRHNIPVTTPIETLIDIAHRPGLEAAINEADNLDLCTPEQLHDALDRTAPRPGIGMLRALLDRHTFTLTDSELERAFLPIARGIGLPEPQTRRYVNGFKADFYFEELGIVVEADGGRHHRTPFQQTADRRRDHAHFLGELIPLRFTHAQIAFEPDYVAKILSAALARAKLSPARARAA